MSGEDRGLKDTDSASAADSELPPFDAQKYRDELGDLDITEEQATEFLRTLDFILRSFVDLGWGVDSVQKFIPALAEFSSHEDSGAVQQTIPTPPFNRAAAREAEKDDSNAR
ncbi:MAG TPA: hypothetical protein VGE08_03940 [Steroidobacter sp.]|uniref:hypothetical protein n=1 Tax=Steroidobacter sp. TaxID=1978227 RepID=UPI002ED822B2